MSYDFRKKIEEVEIKSGPSLEIYSLMKKFNEDPNSEKINLGIGMLYDERGENIFQFKSVKEVKTTQQGYLNIPGCEKYIKTINDYFFGFAKNPVTIQTIGGGTLSNFVFASFLKQIGVKEVYFPEQTWVGHPGILKRVGLEYKTYPYHNKDSGDIKFSELKKLLKEVKNSVFCFHASCHNPTGVDLNKNQIDEVINLLKANNNFIFFDASYLGFATGSVSKDSYFIKKAYEEGLDMAVALNFGKIFSKYSERHSSLTFLSENDFGNNLKNIEKILSSVVRSIYSNPSSTFEIIHQTLKNEDSRTGWENELKEISLRLKNSRKLVGDLFGPKTKETNGLVLQSNLTKEQIGFLLKNSIYVLLKGRINVSNIVEKNHKRVIGLVNEARRLHP